MKTDRTKEYFPQNNGDPAPLKAFFHGCVRFEEADQLGIVWHGRYASYLEDGRTEFGKRFGISYSDMRDNGFLAPVVQMRLDYASPLRFAEKYTVETRLHWTDAAKLNFSYVVSGENKRVAAEGLTVQLLTDLDMNLLLARPPYLEKIFSNWKDGLFDE